MTRAPSDALSTLTCPACGASVPIADAATTRCPHCAHDTPVPVAYRDALALSAREVEADALTREAFRTLGSPPAWPLVLIDALTSGFAAIATTTLLTFIAAVKAIDWALDHGASWFHVNAWDWFSTSEQELVLWGSSFGILLTLFVLGAFGRRRARDLQRLHKALAARPPPREGGPALCRDCGAPLTVPANALGVRCAYCNADNLVAIPESWLARARGGVEKVTRETASALHQYRADVRRVRIHLAIRIAVIVALAVLMLRTTVRHVLAGDGGDFDLRAKLDASPRRLFDLQPRAVLAGTPGPAAPRIPVDQCASMYVLQRNDDMACLDGDCWVGWFVALRAGETLAIESESNALAHFFAHYENRGWTEAYGNAASWGTEVAHADVAAGRPAQFRATITSWYRITLDLHGVTGPVDLCAAIR